MARRIDPVILDAMRSPFHSRNGQLSKFHIQKTAGQVFRETVRRAGLLTDDFNRNLRQVIVGTANQAGNQGTNVGARAVVEAFGTKAEGIYTRTINSSCGSSLDGMLLGGAMIEAGRENYVLTGGMEANVDGQGPAGSDLLFQTTNPLGYISNFLSTLWIGTKYAGNPERIASELLRKTLPSDFNFSSMNESGDYIARLFGYTREELDKYAALSFERAIDAVAKKLCEKNIVPIDMGQYGYVNRDEIREATSLWALSRLKPTIKGGFHHAGNSSQFGVGASAVVLANEEVALKDGHRPLARIIGQGEANVGIGPGQLLGPLKSVPLALVDAGFLRLEDINDKRKVQEAASKIDLWEVNEAYAAEALVVKNEFDIPIEKLNVNGGAIALTHPFGATGTRLVGDVVHEMERRAALPGEGKKPKYALVTLCVAQGLSVAVVIERWEPKKVEIPQPSLSAACEIPRGLLPPSLLSRRASVPAAWQVPVRTPSRERERQPAPV